MLHVFLFDVIALDQFESDQKCSESIGFVSNFAESN